jgi:predicted pyridoxine 5'-phosphate oxidase superfamily flavin-nucleotide-binding protein
MAKFTQDMKDIAAKADPFVLATASKNGKPNGVPIGLVKIISDDEIMLVDNFMNKTRQNIDENPTAAVTFWSMKDLYGYQFKGKARVETSGKPFDEAIRWVKDKPKPIDPKHLDLKLKAKAIVVVKVEEIYYVGANKDSSINLAK